MSLSEMIQLLTALRHPMHPEQMDAIITKLRAAEELATCIDDNLGNHALVINTTKPWNRLRDTLTNYHNAGKGSE